MRKLLKLFGVGILTGAGTRAGIMLMESLFPNGFGGFLSGLKTRTDSNTKQPEETTRALRLF